MWDGKDLNGVTAIVLDLDNTLYDQRDYWGGALEKVADHVARTTAMPMNPLHLRGSLRDAWHRLGTRHPRLFNEWAESQGLNPAPEEIRRWVRVFHEHKPERLDLFDGVRPMLQTLRSRCRIGIVTDGDARMQENKVEALQLRAEVDRIVLTSSLNAPKPSPVGIRVALEQMGANPDQAVYVGDHPDLDCPAARDAGVYAIRVATGEYADLPDNPDAPPQERAENVVRALSRFCATP